MIGKALPSILGRNNLRSAQTQNLMGAMDEMGSQVSDVLGSIGEPTDIRSNDSGGEFTDHPAKM
jgi:hypothetical protein